MEERNWTDIGIVWNTEQVSKQHGPHATDKKVLGDAQIPTVVDLTLFREHFGDEAVLGSMNGTSIRVSAQAVCRQELSKDAKCAPSKMRNAVYNRMKSVRNAPGGTRVIQVFTLPNGQKYNGSDLTEYRQLYAAALVDSGVPSSVALSIAEQQVL